ncbi:MAG: hypothetical protein L3K15_06710, partial [Thermoplasmata archaeon]|nr:hypothetical protein [Thermoplasmata archaeon]
PGMDADQAILLALEGLRQSLEDPANVGQVEVCTVRRGQGLRRYTPEESQKYAARLPPVSSGNRPGRA